MNLLSVSKLQKEFNGDVLFNNISFEINSKDKIAIIGKNGTGKSTLIKMIIGDLEIDKGDVYKNSKAVFGYLSQDVISSKSNTLIHEMNEVFKDLIVLGEKIDESLVSHEEMRHSEEKKDHFIINQEKDFDTKSLKKSLKMKEYGSGTVDHLDVDKLKTMMKKLKWVQ